MTISYPRMDEHHAYLPHSGRALLKLPLDILVITSPLIFCQWNKLQSPQSRWDDTSNHARPSHCAQQAPWTFHIDINIASAIDFELLENIGPALATRIIETRTSLPDQRFNTLNELLQVNGIGDKTLDKLRPYLICN